MGNREVAIDALVDIAKDKNENAVDRIRAAELLLYTPDEAATAGPTEGKVNYID